MFSDGRAESIRQRLRASEWRSRQCGEREHGDDDLSHGCFYPYDLLPPSTIRAAPAELPLRISFISAMVSCSSATLRLSASNRLSRAEALCGSDRSASRLSEIA